MKKIIYPFLSLLAIISCNDGSKNTAKTKPDLETTLVFTAKPTTGNDIAEINTLAVVINAAEAKPSFKTGGVIAHTLVEEGDYVKKGQLLAKLNLSEIDAQVRQAEEGNAKAERDLARVKNLYADSVATLEQIQNAATALEMARKSLDIVKFNRQYSEARSPISGRVIKQILHEGEVTGPGMPVYVILGNHDKDWKVRTGLIDRDWSRIKVGDKAHITLDANPTERYHAIVSEKAMVAGNATSQIDVKLRFTDKVPNLAAGLLGKATLYPEKKTGIMTIPIEALTRSNGNNSFVFLFKTGKAVKTKIITGAIKGNEIEVLSGLNAGDEVITTGAMYLEDGDAVKIKS
ncbi:MAG: efflux RND transporter periplasmic adaptor subunit [Saprospiraceae bacterium]|nr:efflux RND transporter periplasmic adaptor subunit [Saprospiraceae bacterium]